jgi:hypothetical protein
MIKSGDEVVTDNVYNGLRFSGENEDVIRSPSLHCNVASLTQSLWANLLMDDT